MGSSTSKPEQSGYQWKAYVPINLCWVFAMPAPLELADPNANDIVSKNSSGTPGVSMPVLDSLQSSAETDASRAKLLEQQIHARVADELKKLQKREAEALAAAHDKIAAAASSSKPTDKADDSNGPTRFTVSKEVDALRKKLEERKQVRALPDDVEAARTKVIECLRAHDRRPLDCWQEVDDFKAEVKKLEKSWVDKVVS